MGIILNEYHNFVEYTIFHSSIGEVVVSEPIGWEDDAKEIIRDPKAHGKRTKGQNNSLEFPNAVVEGKGNGYQIIIDLFNLYGINAEVILRRYVKDASDPSGNRKAVEYQLTFDYSTLEIIDNEKGRRIKIKSKDEGIGQIIMSRLNQEIEVERLTTLEGTAIGKLGFDTVALDGKKIFLDSNLSVENGIASIIDLMSKSNATRSMAIPLPVEIKFSSDNDVITPVPIRVGLGSGGGAGTGAGEVSMLFLVNTLDNPRELTLNISFDFLFRIIDHDSPTENKISRIDLLIYKDVADNTAPIPTAFKERTTLLNIDTPKSQDGNRFSYSGTEVVILDKNDGIGLVLYGQARMGWGGITNGRWDFETQETNATIEIKEDSFFDKSQAKFLLPFELGERLTQIIVDDVADPALSQTRSNVFKSDFLGRTDLGHEQDGEGALTGITTGILIRGFDETDFDTGERKDQRFKTSLADFLDSFSALWNTGWSIETDGPNQYLRFEEMKHFYQNIITIRLPNKISNVKRTVSKNHIYSEIEVGNKRDVEPEEVMGLDEPNKKSKFSTIITRLKNKLELLHAYSTSMYNKEFARRKQKSSFPNEDTKYDSLKFFLDLKRGPTSVFEQRKWQDDFSTSPTGIFDPDSGTEYRFSPANTLLRSSWIIRAGLEKYLNKKTNYISSQGNSAMATQLIGSSEIREDGDFVNNTFEIPRFLPEIIEFEHEVTYKELAQVDGKTTKSNGEIIENFYGLIEFNNEKNQKEYGYLLNLKPNGKGKWKILKANQ